jgi:basic membrane protein A
MKKRTVCVLLSLVLVLVLVMAGCSSDNQQTGSEQNNGEKQEKLKVGFIYVGPVGDAGWTYAHDLGRKYLEEQLGVETTYVESVPEGADAERVLTQLAEEGNKVIFATSFGYMDPVINVAKKYPDVVFMHCSGYMTADNAGTYFGRMYQPRYLSGIAAGYKTKSNIIGYVAAFPIPEVIRGINAFTLGVRSVNPDAKVKVVWTHTWYDPAAEKDAAISLLDAGADVIAQHQDTPGPQQAAQERGAFSVGYNTDMKQFAPKAYLTAPIWNWGPYYVETVKAVMDGTWKSEQYWGGMQDNIVGLAPLTELVDEEAKTLIEQKKQEIIDGRFKVFAGPIKDQNGELKVKEGEALTDTEMLEMNWFVEGVEGTISQ